MLHFESSFSAADSLVVATWLRAVVAAVEAARSTALWSGWILAWTAGSFLRSGKRFPMRTAACALKMLLERS